MAGGNLEFDRRSIRQLAQNLEVVRTRALEGASEAMFAFSEAVLDRSLGEIPRNTGTAASTVYVTPATEQSGGEELKSAFGYAGPETDLRNPESGDMVSEYIVDIHEGIGLTLQSGKTKFLEDPLNASRGEFIDALVYGVAAALEGVGFSD